MANGLYKHCVWVYLFLLCFSFKITCFDFVNCVTVSYLKNIWLLTILFENKIIWIIYNQESDNGILTFNIKGVFAQDEATLLNYKGIAVRSGEHCAKILDDYLKTKATCRMSTYLYTTKEDIDAFVDAIKNGGDILDAYFND